MVRLFVHSKDLWPRPPHVKHLMELVLMVSSYGLVDDEALDLKLLEVGGRLEVVVIEAKVSRLSMRWWLSF